MTATTYFVVQPYVFSARGRLTAEQPLPAQSSAQAERMAERHARSKAGAIAFSRVGDPETGDFEDAQIIGTFGQVPDLTSLE